MVPKVRSPPQGLARMRHSTDDGSLLTFAQRPSVCPSSPQLGKASIAVGLGMHTPQPEQLPGFESRICHFLAVLSWASSFSSLCLCFVICEMIIIVPHALVLL